MGYHCEAHSHFNTNLLSMTETTITKKITNRQSYLGLQVKLRISLAEADRTDHCTTADKVEYSRVLVLLYKL